MAGVLELAGRTKDDPEIVGWLAEHRARNGGKVRVSVGATGVRLAFAKQADLEAFKVRSDSAARAKAS